MLVLCVLVGAGKRPEEQLVNAELHELVAWDAFKYPAPNAPKSTRPVSLIPVPDPGPPPINPIPLGFFRFCCSVLSAGQDGALAKPTLNTI